MRKSAGVLVGSATKRIEPEYPVKARQEGISGRVVIQVTIDERGQVMVADPISGPEVLREAAARAARRWRFRPTYLSGVPVKVVGEITFNFELDAVTGASNGIAVPQGRTVSANSPMLLLTEREKRGLAKHLEAANPVTIMTGDEDAAMLGIAAATIRFTTLDGGPGSSGIPGRRPGNKYAMRAVIILVNRTDERVISAGLQFSDAVSGQVFYVYPNRLSIGGRKRGRFEIPLMLLNEDPSHLQVQAVGGLFADSSVWGAFPFPPPLKATGRSVPEIEVDSKPEPLSSVRPNYTDEARRNRVRGAVRLGLQIGVDGAVKALEVLNDLPDGLTDEAVRLARRMSFRPATKSGGPVACPINLDIEFRGG